MLNSEHQIRKRYSSFSTDNDFKKKQELIQAAAQYLKIKDYELIIKSLEYGNKNGKIIFNIEEKKKMEIGSEVVVNFQGKVITDKISYIDFDFQFIKIDKTNQVPYAFDKLIFVETVKIEKDGK